MFVKDVIGSFFSPQSLLSRIRQKRGRMTAAKLKEVIQIARETCSVFHPSRIPNSIESLSSPFSQDDESQFWADPHCHKTFREQDGVLDAYLSDLPEADFDEDSSSAWLSWQPGQSHFLIY